MKPTIRDDGRELEPSQQSPSKGVNITTNKIPKAKSLIAILCAVVTFIVFLPALQNEFVNWDDDEYVYNNPFIHSFDTRLLKSAFWDFHADNWHPLTWISHALDYAIWGLNPMGHHLTSVLLHAVNTFIVVLLTMKLIQIAREGASANETVSALDERGTLIAGGVTGFLFGLHPLHVESVAWVSERKDLLCALFFLLSIGAYSRYVRAPNSESQQRISAVRFFSKRYMLSLLLFVLALLSKPMAVSLPVVLLIIDYFPFQRIHSIKTFLSAVQEKIPFVALSLVSSVLTVLAQRGAIKQMEFVPFSTRILVAARSLIAYLWKIIWPNLSPYYPYPAGVSLFSLEYLAPICLLVGITIFSFVATKKNKLWLSAWGYYVITLLPVLGIVQVGGQAMADRYTYLPSFGPFLIIGVITVKVYEEVTALNQRRVILRIAGILIFLSVLILISYDTIGQIGIWKNSLVFWNYVIEKEPGRVPFAHDNLGIAYVDKGLSDKAIEQFQTALRLKPDLVEAHINLGNTYGSKGLFDMEIQQYQIALSLKPNFVTAHYNLGNAYLDKGLLDEAIKEFQTTLSLKPNFAAAHNDLGNAYRSKGLFDMARQQYQTALRLKPDYAEAHKNLGLTYLMLNDRWSALKQYEILKSLEPKLADELFNLIYK